MTNFKTTIGVLSVTFEYTCVCTVSELYDHIRDGISAFTARQYCDFRYSTNLERFKYDPFTGENIDWKEVKRLIE